MRRSPRAVVVGGGQNGLSAGITLAERGWSVTICEADPQVGGAVRTAEATLPGFRHDLFSAVYPAAVASPVFERWPLERHGLKWVHPPVPMAHPFDGGRAAVLARDVDETAENLEGFTAGDGRRWAAYARPYVDRFATLRRVMLGGFPPVGGGLRLIGRFKLSGTLEFARLLLMPGSGLAGELFDGDEAAAWFYGSALHGDVGPHASGSAIAGMYLNVMAHAVGWPSPEGGADRLIRALVGHFESLGGRIRTGARVDRVLVEKGRAVGVSVAGGDHLPADAVVCDLSPGGMARIAGHALPDATLRRYRHYRHGPGTLKIDWALDGPVPWTSADARRAGTVHVGGGPDEIARAVAEVELGNWPERPFMLTGSQTIADPTRAPEGKHTAWAYTHTPGIGTPGEVEAHVERMEAQMERFAPGFRDVVLARHVGSPADIEAANPNLKAGDVGAGSYALDQTVFRPVPSLSPYRTPLRGLYIGSAATFPGGAVHGVGGHAAAKAANNDYRRRTWVVLGKV
jgi:phytoene dehydrogenase-like protein